MVDLSFRIEKDVLGEIKVPSDAYWGINTQRAIQNFQISDRKFPHVFIKSLAQLKKACLMANMELGSIEKSLGDAILQGLDELLDGKFEDQFPIDIFQTGSGTQTNMNMNEVIANRACEILGFPKGKKYPVHPNDHVNRSQSSNDVIPSSMHIVSMELISKNLIPALEQLIEVLNDKIREFTDVIKVGRTHLQDAVPIPLSTEFKVYRVQVENSLKRLNNSLDELYKLPIGGTAVGTGINAPKEFARNTINNLGKITGHPFKENEIKAEGIASHNTLTLISGILRSLALSLIKMANDIRWMGSGPRAGLSELVLPQNEPGSSIMPGKINPTQSEALIQACLQVIGNDSVIMSGEGYGSLLDLNVSKPLMIYNLIDSLQLLSNSIKSFIKNCLLKLKPNAKHINSQLEQILMTVTNLTPLIGYDKCSEIALKAFKEGKTIKEVIDEMGLKFEQDLDELLNPKKMV